MVQILRLISSAAPDTYEPETEGFNHQHMAASGDRNLCSDRGDCHQADPEECHNDCH